MEQTTTQEIKRFQPKTEAKVLSALNKMLSVSVGITEEEAIKKEDFGIMSQCNCFMIIAKSEEAKRVLCRFYDPENDSGSRSKIPNLKYEHGNTSKYKTDFLLMALKLINCCDTSVNLSVAGDYPITIESEHFKIIIAPRVE